MLRAAGDVTGNWHVALIRIGFDTDRKDNLSSLDISSGNGGFMLQPDDNRVIDPAPHNRAYFDAHMTCLRNYYRAQSCEKIDITWEIFPSGDNECYKLTDPADYGPGSGMWSTGELVTFVHDAILAADTEVDYNQFDAVVIAHAGPNLQSDVNNDTPNDIPSFFARLGDDDRIITDDGKIIVDCSVIPESGAQDGYYSGIIPVLAHEFGHQLGLPDLYNIVTGGTGIGIWGNMGSGGQLGADLPDGSGGWKRVDGVLPAGLCAWSKYYLGWATVDTVEAFREGLQLAAVEKPPAEIIRVDISNDEYFLLENRCTEIDELLTGIVVDDDTGVFLGIGNCTNCSGGIPDDLEFEMSTEYDYLLPTESGMTGTEAGPGILIWHIDERLIASRWEENQVNSRNPAGVRLMEAGGVLDIGDPTSPLSYGSYNDAYYQGNKDNFSDNTMPLAWSNMGVPSGVSIEDISARDTLMTFSGGRKSILEVGNIFADTLPGSECMVPIEGGLKVLVVDDNGNGWISGMRSPVFSLGYRPVLPPAYAPGFFAGEDAVLLGDEAGNIHAYSVASWTEPSGGFPVSTEGLAAFVVSIETDSGPAAAVADNSGRVSIYNADGEELSYNSLPPGQLVVSNIAASVDSSGLTDELVFISAGESSVYIWWWNIHEEAAESVQLQISPDKAAEGVIASGDILPMRDGVEAYLVTGGSIYLCSRDGIIFKRDPGGYLYPPAVADMNGDTALDIVVTNGDLIYAISPSGANLTGWPREVNSIHNFARRQKVASSVSVVASENGARVIAATRDGILLKFDWRGDLLDEAYPERVAASMQHPVLFSQAGEEAAALYIDILENGTGEYYGNRGERRSVKWRKGILEPGEIEASWFGYNGDIMRRSFSNGIRSWNSPASGWADLDRNLVIYPNPVEGGMAGFQFRAPSGSHASLMIFNIAGEVVLERDKRCEGGEEHEIQVQMKDTGSGVYIARLVVVSGGRSFRALKKFAVVN